MEVQLQDLLNTIKKDGVETAQKEADAIISKAEDKAKEIVDQAKKEAEQYSQRAKQEAAQFESSAKAAVTQAGRDVLISVKQSLQASFDAVIQKTISEVFSGDKLADAIASIVKNYKESSEVQISEAQFKTIESSLKSKLGSEIKAGLKLSPSKSLSGGFVLKEENGKAYYDFSDESIAEVITAHLSAQISELISVQ